jgi:RIP metalloprotease RseP
LVIFSGVGVWASTATISSVVDCVPATPTQAKCLPSDPISPAKAARLRAGDRFISINGKAVSDWARSVEVVRNSPGVALDFQVMRNNQELAFTITPATRVVAGKREGFLGVSNEIAMRRAPLSIGLLDARDLFGQIISSSLTSLWSLPSKIPTLLHQTFGGAKRDSASLVGVIGVAEASAQNASSHNSSPSEKIATFLLMIASLNIFVGIFNLLPLLPLDGGHMAVATIDGLRNSWARVRRRSLPRPIDIESLTPITVVVFIFLAALSILLLAADIFNPIHFNL